jgi:hypothetical protein
VTGTVRMLDRIPALPAVTQNDSPPRSENSFGFATGTYPNQNLAGSRRTIPRSGKYVDVSRTRKS